MTNNQDCTHFLDKFGFRFLIGFIMFTMGTLTLVFYFQIRWILEKIFSNTAKFNTTNSLIKGIVELAFVTLTFVIILILLNIYRNYKKNPISLKHIISIKLISYILVLISIMYHIDTIIQYNNIDTFDFEKLFQSINPLSSILLVFSLIIRILSEILKEAINIKKDHDYTI